MNYRKVVGAILLAVLIAAGPVLSLDLFQDKRPPVLKADGTSPPPPPMPIAAA